MLVYIGKKFSSQIKDIGNYKLLDVSLIRISRISISLTDVNKLQIISYDDHVTNRVVNLENNPVVCGCEIYDFLRIIKTNNHKLEFKTYDLLCHDCYHHNTEINDLDYKCFLCRIQYNNTCKNDACSGISDCWVRPFDDTTFIDCASKKLSIIPQLSSVKNASKIQLNLKSNNI